MGQLGLPIFAGLGGAAVPELARAIAEYRAAWREAGHPGDGDVMLRVGIYVAEEKGRALSKPRDRLVYGTPDAVATRLRELQEELGLSGVLMEPNVGGMIPPERLEHSIRLFS